MIILVSIASPSLFAYQKGISLLLQSDPAHDYLPELREIKDTGATHISLIVSWYQDNIHSQRIYPRRKIVGDFHTIPDEVLERVIDQARSLGLEVFLFPILRIENREAKEWRGVVAPRNKAAWLKSYRNFTMYYARLAAREKVALFSVGSELCSMEDQRAFWRRLIRDVRRFYRGKLLYSANWDHYQKIGFWKDLDFLGLNAYYELTASMTPTVEELVAKWWNIENEIRTWQEKNKKPLIITEIGYPSVDGTCSKPWDYTREAAIDLGEQALCYEAFFRAWLAEKKEKIAGVYFWNWYGQGGPTDPTYTPRGKPALDVLRSWYRQP